MKFTTRIFLAFIISFTLSQAPLVVSRAEAGMITTAEVVDNLGRQMHEQNVQSFLSRDDVKSQLTKMGISPDEAQRRVASLSDKELKKLSGEVDHAIAGGSVAGVLIIVVLVLLIIYLFKRV